jgi:hypothetical protein
MFTLLSGRFLAADGAQTVDNSSARITLKKQLTEIKPYIRLTDAIRPAIVDI